MSIDGTLIADIRQLYGSCTTSLFFLVVGPKGSGKSTNLHAVVDGLLLTTPSTQVEQLEDDDDGQAVKMSAPEGERYRIFSLNYSTLMNHKETAVPDEPAGTLGKLHPYSIVVVDDLDLLWAVCELNGCLSRLQHVIRRALKSPKCAVVAASLSTSAVPSWLQEWRVPVVYELLGLTSASARRMIRTSSAPMFQALSEAVCNTVPLPSSRRMMLFNCCMTLHQARDGRAADGAAVQQMANTNARFLQHVQRCTAKESRRRPLYGLEKLQERLTTMISIHAATMTTPGGRLMTALPSTTGVLLHGPSGCGKTALVQAVRSSLPSVPFLVVQCTALFSKYLGESEEQLRAVYRRARASAPAVVVLDDIDVIAQSRGAMQGGAGDGGKGHADVTRRMLAGLLCELDGVVDNSGVLTIGLTNVPRILDGALLRQGRLETILAVPPLTYAAAEMICVAFFERFDGSVAERAERVHFISNRSVGCAVVSLQYFLRKIFEEAMITSQWSAALTTPPLPSQAVVDRLLFENCSMMPRVQYSGID